MTNLSHNELRSILKRAFEGIGWNTTQYQDAAENTLWLEAVGLEGIKRVINSWPRIIKLPSTPSVIAQVDDTAIDIENDSLIRLSQTICDYVIAKAQDQSNSQLEIRNCTDRSFIIPSLASYAKSGYHLVARWYTPENSFSAMNDPSDTTSVDCVQGLRLQMGKRTTDTLFIACSRKSEHVEQFQNSNNVDVRNRSSVHNLSAQEISRNYQKSLKSGIPVKDEWVMLLENHAANILVPSSDLSRAGAGD